MPFHIVVLGLDTGIARTVFSSKEWIGGLAWSPDGTHILASLERGGASRASGLAADLAVISVAQGTSTNLKIDVDWRGESGLRRELVAPDWSPDGRQIAFTAASEKEEIYLKKNVMPKAPRED
jgi:Tol biopolymer transport system component